MRGYCDFDHDDEEVLLCEPHLLDGVLIGDGFAFEYDLLVIYCVPLGLLYGLLQLGYLRVSWGTL